MEKAIVIISGGMDSTTLIYDVKQQGYKVYALSFNYNQRHKKELLFAKKTCKKLQIPHKIVNLYALNDLAPSSLTRKNQAVPEGHYKSESMKQTVVPNRNMVMLSLAAAHAMGIGATKLFYGAHAGDHAIYPDCRPKFVKAMYNAIRLADWNIVELKAPYLNLDKGDIAILGKKLSVDYSFSWTCYKGKKKACGKCGACQERLEAFKKAKIKDPIEYEA
jgi:7-cyano-7-deazaguanine synthase